MFTFNKRWLTSTPRVPLFINGQFIESKTSEWLSVHDPVSKALTEISIFSVYTKSSRFGTPSYTGRACHGCGIVFDSLSDMAQNIHFGKAGQDSAVAASDPF